VVFPYLLRDRAITAPNQVWAMDITYLPMRRGFIYLAAVLARYFTFYNQGRPHTALDGQTPDMVYFAPLPQREAA